jgi:hypothetical protein
MHLQMVMENGSFAVIPITPTNIENENSLALPPYPTFTKKELIHSKHTHCYSRTKSFRYETMTMNTQNGDAYRNHHPDTKVHLGLDILLEVSRYLDPIDYSAVSKLFWTVAEERADALLKVTEDRCFVNAASDWSSQAVMTKWKLRLGLSVVEGYRSFQEEIANTSTIQTIHKSATARKRKRSTMAAGDDQIASSEALHQGAIVRETGATTGGSFSSCTKPDLNLMASRLLWNQASRVPLTSTMGNFWGPSAMLPDGHHIAFFRPEYLQIVVINIDATADHGRVVHMMSVKDIIPAAGNSLAFAGDLRLVCSDDGHLTLYCNHHCHDPLLHGKLGSHETPSLFPSPTSSKRTETSHPLLREAPRDLSSREDDSNTTKTPEKISTGTFKYNSCWMSVWKISSSTDSPVILKHQYFRGLDASNFDASNSSNTDHKIPVLPVQEMTVIPSSGNLVLLRYWNDHDFGQEDDSGSSIGGTDCWIESLEISSGTKLVKTQVPFFHHGNKEAHDDNNTFSWIRNSQLSVPEDGNHVLVTLDGSSQSCPEATTIRHYTLNEASLKLVDFCETPLSQLSQVDSMLDDEDEDEDEEDDVFVQHAGRRILHWKSNRRCFPSDPKIVSPTGFVLIANSDGQFSVDPPPPESKMLFPMKPQKRWKLIQSFGRNNRHGLFEDPDESEIVLDEIHLESGKRIRSIRTGVTRFCYEEQDPSNCLVYSVESIHAHKNRRHGGDAFVVVSGSQLNPSCSGGRTIVLRILSSP